MGSAADEGHPEFFKVFLPQHCSDYLRIPDAFEDEITGKIPNKVIMKNSIGKLWPVDVGENEDGLYFQGGWSKFVLDNSLQIGEFMVFKYNGHHMFDVLIYGTNCCEKKLVDQHQENEPPAAENEEEATIDEVEEKKILGNKKLKLKKGDKNGGKFGMSQSCKMLHSTT